MITETVCSLNRSQVFQTLPSTIEINNSLLFTWPFFVDSEDRDRGTFYRLGHQCLVIHKSWHSNEHCYQPVFRIRIHRIHMFLGLPDPDPLVRGMDPDPSIIKQK